MGLLTTRPSLGLERGAHSRGEEPDLGRSFASHVAGFPCQPPPPKRRRRWPAVLVAWEDRKQHVKHTVSPAGGSRVCRTPQGLEVISGCTRDADSGSGVSRFENSDDPGKRLLVCVETVQHPSARVQQSSWRGREPCQHASLHTGAATSAAPLTLQPLAGRPCGRISTSIPESAQRAKGTERHHLLEMWPGRLFWLLSEQSGSFRYRSYGCPCTSGDLGQLAVT